MEEYMYFFVFPFGPEIIVFTRFYKLILHFGGPFGPPPFGTIFIFSFISLSQPEGTYTLAAMHPKNHYFFLLSPERRRKVQKKGFLSKVFFLSETFFLLSPDRRRKVHGK